MKQFYRHKQALRPTSANRQRDLGWLEEIRKEKDLAERRKMLERRIEESRELDGEQSGLLATARGEIYLSP